MTESADFSFFDSFPYEDDGEGYGSRASRGSEMITTTYGGWMTMLRIALVYDWQPEGGSYYCGGRERVVSATDANEIHLALERYIHAPHEAYDRWLAYVSRPKEEQARIFPMGDEEYDHTTKSIYRVDPATSESAAHWHNLSMGGFHSDFARRLSDFCKGGSFRI